MWTFCSSTGGLRDPLDNFVETGYAGGNCGKNPEGINNPAMCGVKDIGPLPLGLYMMGTPVEGTHLGPLAIPLTPDPSNVMGGRSDFYCHGDHIGKYRSASDGCIIMSHATRLLLIASTDKQIQVI